MMTNSRSTRDCSESGFGFGFHFNIQFTFDCAFDLSIHFAIGLSESRRIHRFSGRSDGNGRCRPNTPTPVRSNGFSATGQQVGVVLQHAGLHRCLGVGCFSAERGVAMTVVGRDTKPPPRILAGTGCRFNAAGEAESVVLEFECVQQRVLVVGDMPKGNPLQSLTVTLLHMCPYLLFVEGGES